MHTLWSNINNAINILYIQQQQIQHDRAIDTPRASLISWEKQVSAKI